MIYEDVQKLTPGNVITLYEIDHPKMLGDVERFHNHNDGIIVWQGKNYYPWAIEAADFERSGEAQQPSPKLTVSNIGIDAEGEPITGVISALCIALNDLRGAKLTRHRTMAKYLDAVNFADGNPNADPNQHFPPERWIVQMKDSETPEAVTFTLSSPLQFDDVQLPRRQIIADMCWWLVVDNSVGGGYRGTYCGYTGSAMYDIDDNPTNDPTKDACSGRKSSCEIRFGKGNEIRIGCQPGADRTQ